MRYCPILILIDYNTAYLIENARFIDEGCFFQSKKPVHQLVKRSSENRIGRFQTTFALLVKIRAAYGRLAAIW